MEFNYKQTSFIDEDIFICTEDYSICVKQPLRNHLYSYLKTHTEQDTGELRLSYTEFYLLINWDLDKVIFSQYSDKKIIMKIEDFNYLIEKLNIDISSENGKNIETSNCTSCQKNNWKPTKPTE